MNIKPLQDRVVIRQVEEAKESSGGILLPGSAQQKQTIGEVVATGPGKVADNGTIIPMTVKVGDTVLYGKYAGTELKLEGTDYLIMREDDILAIVPA